MGSVSSEWSALLRTAPTSCCKSRTSQRTTERRSARTFIRICTALTESAVSFTTLLNLTNSKSQKRNKLKLTRKVSSRLGILHPLKFLNMILPYQILYCKIGRMYWITSMWVHPTTRTTSDRWWARSWSTQIFTNASKFSCKYLLIERKLRRSLIHYTRLNLRKSIQVLKKINHQLWIRSRLQVCRPI